MIQVLEIVEERHTYWDGEERGYSATTYLVDRDKAVKLLADPEADIRYTRYIVEDALAGRSGTSASDKYSFGDTPWEEEALCIPEGAEFKIVHTIFVSVGG